MENLVRWWRYVLEHTHFRLRNYANPFLCSSSVGIATGYRRNDQSSIAGRSFSLGSAFVAALTPNQPPVRWAWNWLSTGMTLPGLSS